MKWWIILIAALLSLALVVFLIRRNQKDKKQLEDQLNNDFTRARHSTTDVEAEARMK